MKLLQVRSSPKFGNFTLVDDDDFVTLSKRVWRWTPYGYVVTGGRWKSQDGTITNTSLLHRVITNTPDELVVDHFNSNRNDNRKANLRVCTLSVNAQNKFGSAQYENSFNLKDLVVIKAFYNIDISEEMKRYISSERALFYRCHKNDTDQYVEQFRGLGFTDFVVRAGRHFNKN